jgi:hypothetical protein
MENLILLIAFIWTLCMILGLADLCVTIKSRIDERKLAKRFEYKL